jgi:hypothetical protein
LSFTHCVSFFGREKINVDAFASQICIRLLSSSEALFYQETALRLAPSDTCAQCLKEPNEFMSVCLGKSRDRRKIMREHSLLLAAAALLVISGVASAQNQTSQDNSAPTALQSKTPDKPPVATIPEAATDVAAVPRRAETTGQAPNVSKKMGAEMDSAGDQRASPDEQ